MRFCAWAGRRARSSGRIRCSGACAGENPSAPQCAPLSSAALNYSVLYFPILRGQMSVTCPSFVRGLSANPRAKNSRAVPCAGGNPSASQRAPLSFAALNCSVLPYTTRSNVRHRSADCPQTVREPSCKNPGAVPCAGGNPSAPQCAPLSSAALNCSVLSYTTRSMDGPRTDIGRSTDGPRTVHKPSCKNLGAVPCAGEIPPRRSALRSPLLL